MRPAPLQRGRAPQRIELHVRRLVVHGAGDFDRAAFSAALNAEIAAAMHAGTGAHQAPGAAAQPTAVERVAARVLARRLLP